MPVEVMHVRRVGVVVGQRFVLVRVAMTDPWRHRNRVRVLMMCFMHMGMIMFHERMGMGMFVTFGEMHPDAPTHQRPGNQ